MRQLWLDLDGVLADFDGFYEKLFGVRPNQDTYDPPDLWTNIRKHGTFYRDQPLMQDALELWDGCKQFDPHPRILTGVPYSIPNVAAHKMEWIRNHFGTDVIMIACESKKKCFYGSPGDILVDDRLKYSQYWLDMGGIFVHHKSAQDTLVQLGKLYGSLSQLQ